MKIALKDRVIAQHALEIANGEGASKAKELAGAAIESWGLESKDASAALDLLGKAPGLDQHGAKRVLAEFQSKYGVGPDGLRERLASGLVTTLVEVMNHGDLGQRILGFLDPASRGNLREALNAPKLDHLTREHLIGLNTHLHPDLGGRSRFRTPNDWKMTPDAALNAVARNASTETSLAAQAASLCFDLYDAQIFDDANHRTGILAAADHLIRNGRDLKPGAVTVLHDALEELDGKDHDRAVAKLTRIIEGLMKNGTRSPAHGDERRQRVLGEVGQMKERLELFAEMNKWQRPAGGGKYTVPPDQQAEYTSTFSREQRRLYEQHRNRM